MATLGAASALAVDGQRAWRAGGAGPEITSHLGITALALPATVIGISPSSRVLVGSPLVHTGGFLRGTLGAALPRQVNKLRSLWALDPCTFSPLTEDLTPVAGAELAAGAVPHVSMVTHRPLIKAAPLGGGAFVTTLAGALHFGLTLLAAQRRTGAGLTFGLAAVAHTCGAGVFLPLLAVLVLFTSGQTGVGHTLRTAPARLDHQVLMRFAGHLLTLSHRTLDVPVAAQTSGAEAGLPLLTVSVHIPLP